MVVQSGNDEFHGVDTRGGGMNGHHVIGIDADVGGWDPENIQSQIDDLFGMYMSSLGHVAVVFSTSSPPPSLSSSGGTGSTLRGVFIPLSSCQMLCQIKFGNSSHTGSQATPVLRQPVLVMHEATSRMNGGHSLVFHLFFFRPQKCHKLFWSVGETRHWPHAWLA